MMHLHASENEEKYDKMQQPIIQVAYAYIKVE